MLKLAITFVTSPRQQRSHFWYVMQTTSLPCTSVIVRQIIILIMMSLRLCIIRIQWNLRMKDTWGPEQVSFIQRCPLFGG